jgi:hypothetical protein
MDQRAGAARQWGLCLSFFKIRFFRYSNSNLPNSRDEPGSMWGHHLENCLQHADDRAVRAVYAFGQSARRSPCPLPAKKTIMEKQVSFY